MSTKLRLSLAALTGLLFIGDGFSAVLWSADFEAPAYTTSGYLTGQQGWWHYQNWSQGRVVPFDYGQRARIGGTNGHSELVLSPLIASETIGDKRFRIRLTVQPGGGSDPFLLRIADNRQIAVIQVRFDAASGHILARGGDNTAWTDSGVTYTAATDYRLEIVKADSNWTFALKVNGTWVLRNIPGGNPISGLGGDVYNTVPGIGYLYIYGGGNGGTPLPTAYTYLDNVIMETISDFDRLWSADFESPPYAVNAALTGQQGWWHNQGWTQGLVTATGQGQRARLGGTTGYSEKVLSPWIAAETDQDRRFRIRMTVQPGHGNDPANIRVYDNNQGTLVIIRFDHGSGHIRAKGTDSTSWADTGVAYTPGTDYRLEIIQNHRDHTFSLSINGIMVLRNVPNGVVPSGMGYVYFYGGGNSGVPLVPITDQYTFVDDVSVDVVPDIETIWSADFESPPYVLNSALTGQQGWWHYQNWTQGVVVATSRGQRARLGGTNGHAEKVLGPWTAAETQADTRFRFLATVQPGGGSIPCVIRLHDNNQVPLAIISFDQASGKILAKGTDAAPWSDTGIAYMPGNDYRLEILHETKDRTFSLCVNDSWVLRDIDSGVTGAGVGYVYFYGGGNDGTPIPDQYTYLDDVSIQIIPAARQYDWPAGPWDRLDSPDGPTTLAAEGANITIGYHYPMANDLQIRAWLDQACLNGLQVIVETPRLANATYISPDVARITNFINTFKNHPAVYGWYIADEPAADAHAAIKAGYDLVKSLDGKPVFICFTLDTGLPPGIMDVYADAYDILLMDCYITIQGYPEFHYMTTSTFQGRINWASTKSAAAGKPWWVVLQGWGRTANPVWQARLPTLNELRFMLYYSVSKNARGWLSWCQYLCEITYAEASDPYPYDGNQWNIDVLTPVIDQVHILGPAWSAGAKPGLTDSQSEVLSGLYQDPATQEYYITAVNNYNGDKTASFTIASSIGTFVSAEPLSEDRPVIPISDGTFSDSFSRYGVHVYRLNPLRLPGDASGDGQVAFDDFAIVQNNYGQSNRTWPQGDFSGDGQVTFEDFSILQNHYGQAIGGAGRPAAAQAVSGIPCWAVGLIILAGVGWKRIA